MTTTRIEGRTGPTLLVDVPAGFTGLPLGQSEDGNVTSANELAAPIAQYAGQSATDVLPQVNLVANLLQTNNILLYGRFAASGDEDTEPALADLALAVAPLGTAGDERVAMLGGNRDVAAAALRRQYVARSPHADARLIRLGAGPAMVALIAGEYRLPPEMSRRHVEIVVPQIKCEFQIPAPDGTLVMLTVGTSSETGYAAVLTAAMRIANSLRIEYPAQDGAAR